MITSYIGPGIGAGAIAAALGLLAGIVLLFAGFVWYPIKRLINWIRNKL